MQSNVRFDAEDLRPLGIGWSAPAGSAITVNGDKLYRDGTRWYGVGPQIDGTTFGSYAISQTRAELFALLDRVQAIGANHVAMAGFEEYGLVSGGSLAGAPLSIFDNGRPWAANSTFAAGDVRWTTDSSGNARVYLCDTAGAGATSGNGPSGTTTGANSINDGAAAKWHFLRQAFSQVNPQFFTGDGTSAGLDFLMDELRRRGMHLSLRFNKWQRVIQGRTGYPLSGAVSQLAQYFGCWHFDGENGTPTVATFMRDYLTTILDRVNSINGLRYGDDETLWMMNLLNEQGYAYWFFNAGYSNSGNPRSDTWDMWCKQGGPLADATNPLMIYLAAWDTQWAAYYAANYPADNGGVPAIGGFATMPTKGWYGTLGTNVAARGTFETYHAGSLDSGIEYLRRKRLVEYLEKKENAFVASLIAHCKSKAPHLIIAVGQQSWCFPSSMALGDLFDDHFYDNSSLTTYNTLTTTTASTRWDDGTFYRLTALPASTLGNWSAITPGTEYSNLLAGTYQGRVANQAAMLALSPAVGDTCLRTDLTTGGVAGALEMSSTGADTSRPLAAGQYLNLTQTSGGSFSATVRAFAYTGSTAVAVRTNPFGAAGTAYNATVELPNSAASMVCAWHAEPPGNNAANGTRHHISTVAAPNEADYDFASLPGSGNYGNYINLRSGRLDGGTGVKPSFVSEFGKRYPTDPTDCYARFAYVLLDLLRGGSGVSLFSVLSSGVNPSPGEHVMLANAAQYLGLELCSLMTRYGNIPEFPATDVTQVTADDMRDWYSRKNQANNYSGNGYGWVNAVQTLGADGLNSQYVAFLLAKLVLKLGASTSKSNASYSVGASGAAIAGLTDPNTGRLYYDRNQGLVTFETSHFVTAFGRLPGSTTLGTEMHKMRISVAERDGATAKGWYGHVTWVSADGTPLSVGRSHLYNGMYPREQSQAYRRFLMDGRVPRIEHLPGDTGATSNPEAGIVLRNGLEVQLVSPRALTASHLIRGQVAQYCAGYSGGRVYLQPRHPRIIIE